MDDTTTPDVTDKRSLLAFRLCAVAKEDERFRQLVEASFRLTATLHVGLVEKGWSDTDAAEAMAGMLAEQTDRIFDQPFLHE